MFIVTRRELKKTKFITQYDTSRLPEIKLNVINQLKTESLPKEKSHTPPPKSSIKKISSPKNLFSILHNQHQIPIVRPRSPQISHIKKKRIINDETGNTIGRWTREEHKKFIEGIIKYGNNWKQIQDYVNSRTSTQARSHAQKFFEKIKKNNSLKSLGTITVNNRNNFTNAIIQKLHNTFKNSSQDKINSIVNKFLSLEYGLPKKRKRNLHNNYNSNNSTHLLLKKRKKISNKDYITKYAEYNEHEKKDDLEKNNFENENNYEVKSENYDKNDNENNYESVEEYRDLKTLKKDEKSNKFEKICEENNDNNKIGYNNNNNVFNNYNISGSNCNNNYINYNIFNNNYNNYNFNNYNNYNFFNSSNNNNDNNFNMNNYNSTDIDYIFSKFVDNLSNDNLNYKFGKRKNTIESIGGDSLFTDNNLYSYNNCNNSQVQQQNNKGKSRKNSADMNLKFNQNTDSFNDLNDVSNYRKIFNFEDSISNNRFFGNSRKQSALDDEIQYNLFQSK